MIKRTDYLLNKLSRFTNNRKSLEKLLKKASESEKESLIEKLSRCRAEISAIKKTIKTIENDTK